MRTDIRDFELLLTVPDEELGDDGAASSAAVVVLVTFTTFPLDDVTVTVTSSLTLLCTRWLRPDVVVVIVEARVVIPKTFLAEVMFHQNRNVSKCLLLLDTIVTFPWHITKGNAWRIADMEVRPRMYLDRR